MDYEQYSDRSLRRKPLRDMSHEERDYYDLSVEKDARAILGKLEASGPQYVDHVAMKVAEHVLRNRKKEEQTNDLIDN